MKIPDWHTIVAIAGPVLAWLGYSGWKAKAARLLRKVEAAAIAAGRDLLRKLRGKSLAGQPISWWEARLEAELERRGIHIDKLPAHLRARAAAKAHDLIDEFEAWSGADVEQVQAAVAQLEREVRKWEEKAKPLKKRPAPAGGG